MAYDNTREMAKMIASLNPLIHTEAELPPEILKTAFDLEAALSHSLHTRAMRASLVRLLAVSLLGYMLEVRAGNGLWQVFLRKYHELYGRWLPFGWDAAGYKPGELNRADVKWIVWYVLAGVSERQRLMYPLCSELEALTDLVWPLVRAEEFPQVRMMTTKELREVGMAQVCELVYWRHWLLLPAFEQDRQRRVLPMQKQIDDSAENFEQREQLTREMHHDIMASLPTGPLALGISEWVAPLLSMRRKAESGSASSSKAEHKYYTRFMSATEGKNPIYIEGYDNLNRFLSEDMGWGEDEHFPAMRHHHDFTLYADAANGLLICKDVARCIADPSNELYDKDYACGHAFELLTERGRCAPDLLKLVLKAGWLPDAMFPTGSADEANRELTAEAADFLARFYLQQYYTGD